MADVDARVQELKRRHERVRAGRSTWESHWREVADRVMPAHGDFQGRVEPGSKRTEKIFDSTATTALPKFAAALESLMIPTTQKWHGVRLQDERLNERDDVKRWCEAVRDIMFATRNRPAGRFQSNVNAALQEIGMFGNGIVFADDRHGGGYGRSPTIMYRAIPLSQCYFAESFAGDIDTVHREYRQTARQVKQQFGALPPGMASRAEANIDREFTILHCVAPATDIQGAKYRHFPIASYYLSVETDELLEESGYRVMPYSAGRFQLSPNECYGRGPAMYALADIKTLNEMSKTNLRAGQKAVDPPLMLADDGSLQAFSLRPGALNYGGMSSSGQRMVEPLLTGQQLPIALEMEDQRRQAINAHFYINLFMILVENHQMTASEAMLRAQEKGQLLGPSAARLQSDLFGPNFAREFDILWNAGALPFPPRGVDIAEAAPEYTAPLNRLIRSEDAVAMMRWVEQMAPLAQVRGPEVYDVVDPEAWGRELAEIDGVPLKVLRSPQAVADARMQRDQAQTIAGGAEVAATASQAVRNIAEAQAKATSVPPQALLPIA